jgi:hypothetical protein
VLRSVKYLIVLLPVLMMTLAMVTSAQDDPRCARFRRIEGGGLTISTYRWSAVAGINEYKVNFYGSEGQFAGSYWVLPPKTSVDVNLGDLPTGAYFQWEVEALANGGQKVCNTGRSSLARLPHDRKSLVTPQPEVTNTPTPTPTATPNKKA